MPMIRVKTSGGERVLDASRLICQVSRDHGESCTEATPVHDASTYFLIEEPFDAVWKKIQEAQLRSATVVMQVPNLPQGAMPGLDLRHLRGDG